MATTRERYKAPPKASNVLGSGRPTLTDRPVAAYYRQSTLEQVGNISTQLQTVDMVAELKRRGWKPSDIILVDMDAGVSGTKKIDERPGMKYLFELISDGRIGAVACEDEDRLFRDVTQIQVNIFIEACRIARVVVLTPSMVYDFADEQLSTFHARQFRFKCELAAEYISTFVKGKLHRAKRRLALEGRWFGAGVSPGYMIDTRKTLPDGNQNPVWRKYMPFAPFADVVLEYFRLFNSYAGNLHATVRHIHLHGPYYPDPQICQPPTGFRVLYPKKRFKRGYCPGIHGLQGMLTNAVYIGHWLLDDAVAIYNNHPPVVPEDVFWEAFNYLSRVTLEGKPNPHYRPFLERTRPMAEANRPKERPLYSGLMYWNYEGTWRKLGTSWAAQQLHYVYQATAPEQFDDYRWRRSAEYIDLAITGLLLQRIRATFDEAVWSEALSGFSETFQKDRKRIASQLQGLERYMDNQINSLDVLTNPEMIKGVEARYEEAQTEHRRLSAEMANATAEADRLQAMADLRTSCLPALETWDELERDKKRVIVRAFVDRVEATTIGSNGLGLKIHWRDQSVDELVLARQTATARDWLPDEIDQLLKLVDGHATQVEIAAAFSDRDWEAIRHRLWKLRGKRCVEAIDPKPMRDTETYPTYLTRISQATLALAGSGDRWNSVEEKQLLNLLDSGATQVEIAASFPTRRWWRIRAKLTKMRGDNVRIPEVGKIKRNETIADYGARTGEETEVRLPVAVHEINFHRNCPA